MHKVLSFLFAAAALVAVNASAETFAVSGGNITATRAGDDVTITVTGIPAATTLVHFQHQGIRSLELKNGSGILTKVSENGGRFQIRDGSGKWLLITPAGNGFGMKGVRQECRKSKEGCALEVSLK